MGIIKRVRINNQISAPELRVIDDSGNNLGVLSATEALAIAREQGLDLIEIVPEAKPPVAKIMDLGKYKYQEKKKAQKAQQKIHATETRAVQIGFNTSKHDLEMKAKKADEFLRDGDRVKIELRLRGRAKYLDRNFIQERMKRILGAITEPFKVADEPKKSPRGLMMIIEKK